MSLLPPPVEFVSGASVLIGSEWIERTSGGVHQHVYAGNGMPTFEVPLAGAAEVDAAVKAARAAFPAWRAMPATTRRDILLRIAELLRDNAEDIGWAEIVDNGSPVRAAMGTAKLAADWFAHNAGWPDKIAGQTLSGGSQASLNYVEREPYGVVGVIIPWNGPVVSFGMVLGPALAAGNCVVVKPPEFAPFSARKLMQIFLDAGVPPGVVNMVTGGAEAGRALVRHPGIGKIHFTGSPATARMILRDAAETITPCALELGGKSANVIFADADLDAVIPLAMNAIIAKSGQGCIRGTRIIAEASIYEEVLERCAAIAKKVALGDPMRDDTAMGPVISAAACSRIQGVIDRTKSSGAGRLVAGGNKADGDLAPGYYLQPTVFGDVDPASDLAQNEVFGPVMAVMKFETEAQALQLANSTDYALAAYVQTRDVSRAHRMAREMSAGNVWMNGMGGILPNVPFGGNGISGFGRLGGQDGVSEFLRSKNVWLKL